MIKLMVLKYLIIVFILPSEHLIRILDLILLFWQATIFHGESQACVFTITIHLRGVYDSEINLMSLSVFRTSNTINEGPDIKNRWTAKLKVSKDYLQEGCLEV